MPIKSLPRDMAGKKNKHADICSSMSYHINNNHYILWLEIYVHDPKISNFTKLMIINHNIRILH